MLGTEGTWAAQQVWTHVGLLAQECSQSAAGGHTHTMNQSQAQGEQPEGRAGGKAMSGHLQASAAWKPIPLPFPAPPFHTRGQLSCSMEPNRPFKWSNSTQLGGFLSFSLLWTVWQEEMGKIIKITASRPFWPHPSELASWAGSACPVLCMGPLWHTRDCGLPPGASLGSKEGRTALVSEDSCRDRPEMWILDPVQTPLCTDRDPCLSVHHLILEEMCLKIPAADRRIQPF